MILDLDNYLAHYGIKRKSGRYPWGSGGDASVNNRTFLGTVASLRKDGLTETQIAEGFGISTTQLRAMKSIAKNEEKQANIAMAQRLKESGYSNTAIGTRMGIGESSVRALLDPGQKDKVDVLTTTSDMLKAQVAEKKYVDVGVGVERHLNISDTKLKTAVARLQEEGYGLHYVKVEQLGTGKQTTIKVLAAPGATYSEVFKNRGEIKLPTQHSEDGGRSFLGIHDPLSVSSSRVQVRYAKEGGAAADGVIYVRRGVSDVSLGASQYAQVRIKVDGTHYIKGMAMYKDGLPAGTDLVFNTNKSDTGNKLDALKKLKDDPDNPFGAVVRQITTPMSGGKTKVTSAMNIVNEAGDWQKWSKSLSSQMLSKQKPELAQQQLSMLAERKKNELDDILKLTNPTVRKKLLESYADGVDSAAVHLKAAALPRQGNHVILPLNSMKENEVYAPNYKNGEHVVLIRHPHGGIFEIPELVVNNRNPEAKKLLGNAPDAIGIHSKVAERLSGADFDGDTVLVIPNNNRKVKTAPALVGLKGFDPQSAYPGYKGMPQMTPKSKAMQMGAVSNLIADMTIRGASSAELARAVRHSMVVIDAEKHNLNFKQSAIDNGIGQLKIKYQGGRTSGASTLISRASSEVRIPDRKDRSATSGGAVDRTTGKRIFESTNNSFTTVDGKVISKTIKVTRLSVTEDAHSLSSGTPIEKIYADHSNNLKALANKARKEAINTKHRLQSTSAKAVHTKEVASLNAKLNTALQNAPLERRAQIVANSVLAQKRQANPNLEPSEIKRLKSQALEEARLRTGAKKIRIDVTPDEWSAIQAGAISSSKLSAILNNADLDQIKQLATPKTQLLMTSTKTQRATTMLASGYTQAEVAEALGVSLSTLKTTLS